MEPTSRPLTLTVEQAAKVLGIGRSTAYELVHTGAIPSLRLGRRIVVPTAKLAECLGVRTDAILRDRDTSTARVTIEPEVRSRVLAEEASARASDTLF